VLSEVLLNPNSKSCVSFSFLLSRFRAEDLHLGEDAEPEAVMESLHMVDQMLAGGPLTVDKVMVVTVDRLD
jgi:hypothetical protein